MEMEEKGGNKRSGVNSWLFFFLGVFLTASVGLAIALGVTLNKDDDDKSALPAKDSGTKVTDGLSTTTPAAETSALCTTSSCVLRAGEMIASMDTKVDPCEDFYQYACGNWIKTHSIPESKSRYGTFDKVIESVTHEIKGLIEQPYDNSKDTIAIRKAKRLYQSCLNEEKQTEVGTAPLLQLITQLGMSQNVLTGSSSPPLDLVSMLTQLGLLNLSPLVDIGVGTDLKNSSQNIIWVDSASLSLDRERWLKGRNSSVIQLFEEYRRQMAIHVLGEHDNQSLKDAIRQTLDLELELATFTASRTARRDEDAFYRKMTISHLNTTINGIDWVKYLTDYFQDANITVTEHTEVVLFAEDYTKNMLNLTKHTDNRILINYMLMRVVEKFGDYISPEIRELWAPMRKALRGVATTAPRWETCVSTVTDIMPTAMGQLYVLQYFPPTAKQQAKEMVGYIRSSLKQMITDVPWMDQQTKDKAIEKANAVTERIAYPDYQFNETFITELYKNVDYQSEAYFQNNLDNARSSLRENSQLLNRKPDKIRWGPASEVNAFYSPSKNSITFPAGILNPPFYSEDFLKSQMFGGIGVVIGHELTHGFDDQGRKYDKDGNNVPWWSQSSIDNFQNLTQCFVDRYSEQVVAGVHVNGALTLGENIADTGGVKASYKAFQKWQTDNGKQPLLPGLNMTHEQVFFLNFGQVFCEHKTEKAIQDSVMTNPHSPASARIRVTLMNTKEFAENYKCPVGSTMNPARKCTLW